MNIAIALVVFIVAALIVWGCAELNYKIIRIPQLIKAVNTKS